MKVTLLGAAGGIGQALSLLLKTQLPSGSQLALYDIAPFTPGIAVDLSHIPTGVIVSGYTANSLDSALQGADIVLISAGVARKPGMDRADLFNINASIIRDLVAESAQVCPTACIGIITNPLNTVVPIAAEVLKQAGVYDKRKLFGITTLDVMRSEQFISELKGVGLSDIKVDVIGGHSGVTILPLLSQVKGVEFTDKEITTLTLRIQNAGTEVVEAKAGAGSATLSMSQAAARFCLSLIDALTGKAGIIECCYVDAGLEQGQFFAQPVRLGKSGVDAVLPYGDVSEFEKNALALMVEELRDNISLGEQFVSAERNVVTS